MNNKPLYGIQLEGRYVGITNPCELNEVSDWLLDFVEQRGWLMAGSADNCMLYRNDQHLKLAALIYFEKLFRNRWPLFDGKISLQDLHACTLEEWDSIQAFIRRANES